VNKEKVPSVLIGAAGEHFVLYELYRRGLMAGQPPQGVADVDLVVLDENASVITNLQVKTRTYGSDGGWHMKPKHERLRSDRLFYVFVDLEPAVTTSYIIPSDVVADHVFTRHHTWLELPGRDGKAHKDSNLRRLAPRAPYDVPGFPDGWIESYRDRWDLLTHKGEML